MALAKSTERYELVSAAHGAVAKAIRDRRLKAPIFCRCADCGKQAKEYDHRDYRKPLDVAPVCLHCNRKRGPGQPYEPRPKFNARRRGNNFFGARLPATVHRRIEEHCRKVGATKSDLIRRMLDGLFQHEAPLPW